MFYMWNNKKCAHRRMTAFALLFFAAFSGAWARDFLTDQEIARVRNTQGIDKRTDIYMAAAALRLHTAQDRFDGKEPQPGDALEFFSQEEMLEDYYKIMDRVMLIVGDAFESPRSRENIDIKKALNTLKSESSNNLERLAALKKTADEKQKKDLWNHVNRAIDITEGILDGAEEGLSILAEREREDVERRKNLLKR